MSRKSEGGVEQLSAFLARLPLDFMRKPWRPISAPCCLLGSLGLWAAFLLIWQRRTAEGTELCFEVVWTRECPKSACHWSRCTFSAATMEAVAPTGKHCSPDSEAIGVLTSSIGGVACLHFGAGMLVPLQGAAAWCCLRVLLSECCRVPLQGAAVGAACLGALTAAPCTSLEVPKMQTIFCSGTRQGDQQPSSKSTHSILTAWQSHQQLQKRTCQTSAPSSSNLLHPAAAPCSGTLQR